MPSGPVYSSTPTSSGSGENTYKKNYSVPATTPVTNRNTTGNTTSYSGSSVTSTAQQLAKAVLNDSDPVTYINKLTKAGATNISFEVHENACPYRKGIPPISIGGKTYTGKKCAIIKYTYGGKSTGTGACIK